MLRLIAKHGASKVVRMVWCTPERTHILAAMRKALLSGKCMNYPVDLGDFVLLRKRPADVYETT